MICWCDVPGFCRSATAVAAPFQIRMVRCRRTGADRFPVECRSTDHRPMKKPAPAPTYPAADRFRSTEPTETIKPFLDQVQEGIAELDWVVQAMPSGPGTTPWIIVARGPRVRQGLTRERFTPTPQQGETGELGPANRSAELGGWLLDAPGGYVSASSAIRRARSPQRCFRGDCRCQLLSPPFSLDQFLPERHA